MRPNRNKLPLQANGTQSHRLACVKRLSLNIEMKKLHNILLAVLIASAGAVVGQEKTQQERIDALEQQLLELQEQCDKPDFLNQAAAKGLTFNFYGSMKWKSSGGGSSKDMTFDPHRWVLIPSYKLSDNALFMTELELEHGGTDSDGDSGSRFDGYLELEQMYIDLQLTDNITWRAPGVSLIPVGTINENHEPDQFYSAYRPRVYKYIVPTTWMEFSTGLYGDVPSVDGLSYNVLVSSGLSSAHHSEAKDGADKWSMRSTRPGVNVKGVQDLAYTLRLGYDKGGFSGSVSTYQSTYTNQTSEESSMDLYVGSASYNFTEGSLKGLELIGDYMWWDIGNPANVTDSDETDITYDELKGWRLEVAYHIPRGDNELVPFVRLEEYDGGGTANASKEYLTFGAMYKFGDNWEIKLSYLDERTSGATGNEIQLAVGLQF